MRNRGFHIAVPFAGKCLQEPKCDLRLQQIPSLGAGIWAHLSPLPPCLPGAALWTRACSFLFPIYLGRVPP